MIIQPLSDMHGELPPDIPDCDLLLLAGDICPSMPAASQLEWLETVFADWLVGLQRRDIRVVGIAGNHDFVFEQQRAAVDALYLPWTYLQDSGCTISGTNPPLNIWGTPWVPNLKNWAFCTTERQLEARADLIPDNTDIILSHTPPYGGGLTNNLDFDKTSPHHGSSHAGDINLNYAMRRVAPAYVICGHIHEGRGSYGMWPQIINASYLNEWYQKPLLPNPLFYERFIPDYYA